MVAVGTDFHTDDPAQLKADLEKLARAVRTLSRELETKVPSWEPNSTILRADADVSFGTGTRFAAAVAARLPVPSQQDRGKSLLVRVIGAVTVTLTARGGKTVDGSSTASLAGPGAWIAWWDGDEWTLVP